MTRRERLALFAIATGLLAIVFAFKVERRVEHDTAFCTSCHQASPEGGAFQAGAHGSVACQGCHTTKLSTGLALFFQSAAHATKHGKVEPSTCAGCHAAKPADWLLVTQTQGHRQHQKLKNLDCLSCHASTSHGDRPAEKACLSCHKEQRLHKASTAGAETCLSCHSFAVSERKAQPPTTIACERCHASPTNALKEVTPHALHGDVACELCHNAHGKKVRPPPELVQQPVCARCHQIEIFQAGREIKKPPEGHRNCEQCHKPHAPKARALESCKECHPKNVGGVAPTGVAAVVAQVSADRPRSSSALKHQSCASCHLPHAWKAERSGCMTCHADKTQLLLTRSPPEHGSCTKCHEVHGPPPTGAVCLGCHAKTKGSHVALAPQRHKDCTSCHDPHAPSPKDTRLSCVKCHTTEVQGVLRDGPEGHTKESCFGCHKPHDNPAAASNVCAKCHADKARLVSTAGPVRHQACVSCHEKHRFSIRDVATACGSCHGPTRPGLLARAPDAMVIEPGGPHRGECNHCHTLHGSPGVAKAACFKCHEKIEAQFKPPNEQHANCKSCHAPHRPASTAPLKCAGCHAGPAAVAAKWPSASAHAQACNGCHQPHDVRTKKACADCHGSEASSAMGGKHACTQCHPPHDAPPGTGPAWWGRCNACHANKVESAKARGPQHSDCRNCHKPHKFEVPDCRSCHKDILAKGLHGVSQHAAKCTACHDPHVKSEPSRNQCLACHTNRKTHEPEAEKCQACHLFK
jgi:hypothetical protein